MDDTFLTITFYLMHLYTVIQLYLYSIWIYCFKNSIIVELCRSLIFKFNSLIYTYKIEPNYPFICICGDKNETYMNLEPISQTEIASTLNTIASGLNKIHDLIILRNNDQMYSRIFKDTVNDYDISFVKTRKYLLSVEYTHPDMSNRIVIEIDPGLYLIGNEILSSRFVLRCLEYQNEKYVFDDRYILHIMDSKIKLFTITSSEYILIGNIEYEKKSIKILS